jgi:uncharacterized membrane protein
MHPSQRMLLSVAFSVIAYFLIPSGTQLLLQVMMIWIVFSFVFTLSDWIVLFNRPIDKIKKVAQQEDGSRVFVYTMIVLSSFAGLFAVLLLLISGEMSTEQRYALVPLAVLSMLLSWIMVHTVFAFHYAHLYYGDEDQQAGGGLNFPGDEAPDYIDFAYFSLVIGCTFQVSDVEISSRSIRRRVLLHTLISFALNTFVVALTINLIAGLRH